MLGPALNSGRAVRRTDSKTCKGRLRRTLFFKHFHSLKFKFGLKSCCSVFCSEGPVKTEAAWTGSRSSGSPVDPCKAIFGSCSQKSLWLNFQIASSDINVAGAVSKIAPNQIAVHVHAVLLKSVARHIEGFVTLNDNRKQGQ